MRWNDYTLLTQQQKGMFDHVTNIESEVVEAPEMFYYT